MKLTYEEFQKLPMQYTFGLNTDDYCARKYCNEQFNLFKEVVTPRETPGDIYGGFKDPLVSYYIGMGDIFDTPRDLYEGEFLTPWFTDIAPAHSGWYETDRGMLWWGKEWKRAEGDVFPVLPPKQWRGMRDVPAKGEATC